MGRFTQQYLCILLMAQNDPGGRGDLARGDDAGGHLVEQRLEQVVGCLGDHLDVDIGALECLGGGQAAKARTNDDDSVPISGSGSGMAHLGSSTDYTCT